MKAFSKSWKGSKKPRKQRKYTYNAPLHLKRKLVKAKVDESIEEKYKVKTLIVRKNDTVKVLRGEHKGKKGKVIGFSKKDYSKVLLDSIFLEKKAGEKKYIPIHHSNLLIVSVEEDPKRFKRKVKVEKKSKAESKKSEKKESKEVKKEAKEKNSGEKKENKTEKVEKENKEENKNKEDKESKKEDKKE